VLIFWDHGAEKDVRIMLEDYSLNTLVKMVVDNAADYASFVERSAMQYEFQKLIGINQKKR